MFVFISNISLKLLLDLISEDIIGHRTDLFEKRAVQVVGEVQSCTAVSVSWLVLRY